MPFDDPQEQENDAVSLLLRQGPMYPDGQSAPGDYSQQWLPTEAQFQRGFSAPAQAATQPSIGQRILALGQKGSPLDENTNGTRVARNGVGNKILAGVSEPMDSWQIPRLTLKAGVSPASLGFSEGPGQQGLFSTFIPVSDERNLGLRTPNRRQPEPISNGYSSGTADPLQEPVLATVSDTQHRNPKTATPKGTGGASATNGQTAMQGILAQRQQKESTSQQGKPPQTQPLQGLQLPGLLQTGPEPAKPAPFSSASEAARTPPPDPSWTDIREYIAQEARAYGIPVKLAEAVVRHETNFNIHSKVVVPGHGIDWGIMGVNSSNTGQLAGPEGWRLQVDTERVKNDWKYNVHVGMAILKKAYAAAAFNNVGEENIARETYARYNAHKVWKQLYSVPKGKIAQHVNQFMKSWHYYHDEK